MIGPPLVIWRVVSSGKSVSNQRSVCSRNTGLSTRSAIPGLAVSQVPVWVMIATPVADLRARAEWLAERVGEAAAVVDLESTIGGGSLPGQTIASLGVALTSRSADRLLADIRRGGRQAVIGRIEDGRVVLDLRTVEPERDHEVAAKLVAVFAAQG